MLSGSFYINSMISRHLKKSYSHRQYRQKHAEAYLQRSALIQIGNFNFICLWIWICFLWTLIALLSHYEAIKILISKKRGAKFYNLDRIQITQLNSWMKNLFCFFFFYLQKINCQNFCRFLDKNIWRQRQLK